MRLPLTIYGEDEVWQWRYVEAGDVGLCWDCGSEDIDLTLDLCGLFAQCYVTCHECGFEPGSYTKDLVADFEESDIEAYVRGAVEIWNA